MSFPRFSTAILVLSSAATIACSSASPQKTTVVAVPDAPKKVVEVDPCLTSGLRELSQLQKKALVRIYFTPDYPKAAAMARRVHTFFERLKKDSQDRIQLEMVEVTGATSLDEAKEDGMVTAVNSENQPYVFGIAYRYRDEREAIPIAPLDDSKGLRFWMINKIREIANNADKREIRIGVVTGIDELSIRTPNLVARDPSKSTGPTLANIVDQALPYYKLVPVDLREGKPIDPTLQGLVMTQPGRTLKDGELRRIDEFLLRGNKSAVFYTGAANIKAGDATMTATLDRHGIDVLLGGYGIEMQNDLVIDHENSFTIAAQTSNGVKYIITDGLIVLKNDESSTANDQQIDNHSLPFFRVDEVAVPLASTLVVHPEKQPRATIHVLAKSSAEARATRANASQLKFDSDELRAEVPPALRPLAISVEGTILSAFSKDAPPAKGRLLVISSAEFLANPFAHAGNGPELPPQMAMMGPVGSDEELLILSQPYAQKYLTATILSFKNTLDWMTVDDDLLACAAREFD